MRSKRWRPAVCPRTSLAEIRTWGQTRLTELRAAGIPRPVAILLVSADQQEAFDVLTSAKSTEGVVRRHALQKVKDEGWVCTPGQTI